ncbi:Oidioi.mRNA.OKI2018_I69.chr1.g1052.t1.cds [Oikopleura dioica]|uniref:Oidioi.mRNA.OKI2018_I69.chr1.g1052.t1.cds n=1 Tax=Oikopleura dioica TaxID=34765 RepID=A0ABN7SVZ2_OIKDI|nr:Oidioi.mRNA.OKI2018_I69.chr1.g1052.t1.cds [Oikopleura dioica]
METKKSESEGGREAICLDKFGKGKLTRSCHVCLGPRRVAAPAELVGKKHDLTGLSDTNNKQNNMPKASFRKCNRLRPHVEITEEMIKGSIKNS